MQLHRFNDSKEFWQHAQNYLLQYEAEHNVLLGILQTLLHYPERYPEPSYLASVQTNGNILAIAIRTFPNKLLLSKVQDLNALKVIVIPVSMVGGRPFSRAAARIGPVYTPPEYRRKGYATACVAALSQRLLEQGCERCFLFTDLANPTSNSIYQQIGYCPICDWHEYSFIATEQR